MVVVALLFVDIVESVVLVSVILVVNCTYVSFPVLKDEFGVLQCVLVPPVIRFGHLVLRVVGKISEGGLRGIFHFVKLKRR